MKHRSTDCGVGAELLSVWLGDCGGQIFEKNMKDADFFVLLRSHQNRKSETNQHTLRGKSAGSNKLQQFPSCVALSWLRPAVGSTMWIYRSDINISPASEKFCMDLLQPRARGVSANHGDSAGINQFCCEISPRLRNYWSIVLVQAEHLSPAVLAE